MNSMIDSVDISAIESWKPSTAGIPSEENAYGFPTVIYRTPSRLMMECESAFDNGLVCSALCLAVTIPDVCARIVGSRYRDWCADYLELTNDNEVRLADRNKNKSVEEIAEGFEAMEKRGIFTASDLNQLRNAIVHSESSSIDDGNDGARYTPFKSIGVCIRGNEDELVSSFGHTSQGFNEYTECAFDCVISLDGLISKIAKGVCRFIREDPKRDREFSLKEVVGRTGIVDYRSITQLGFQGSPKEEYQIAELTERKGGRYPMSRIWMGPDGSLLTDEQVIRHVATFGSLSAALQEGDIVLLTDGKANAPRSSGGRTGRLADYLGDDLDERRRH